MKIHHLGFLCADLEESVLGFARLGMMEILRVRDQVRDVDLIFMSTSEGELVELVSPVTKDAPTSKLPKLFYNSVYHICYISRELEKDIARLENDGFIIVSPPSESVAFNNNRVVFLYGKHSGLIELVENRYESCLLK